MLQGKSQLIVVRVACAAQYEGLEEGALRKYGLVHTVLKPGDMEALASGLVRDKPSVVVYSVEVSGADVLGRPWALPIRSGASGLLPYGPARVQCNGCTQAKKGQVCLLSFHRPTWCRAFWRRQIYDCSSSTLQHLCGWVQHCS
jgi:hypothetical protein